MLSMRHHLLLCLFLLMISVSSFKFGDVRDALNGAAATVKTASKNARDVSYDLAKTIHAAANDPRMKVAASHSKDVSYQFAKAAHANAVGSIANASEHMEAAWSAAKNATAGISVTAATISHVLEPFSGLVVVVFILTIFSKVPFPLAVVITAAIVNIGILPTAQLIARACWWLTYTSQDRPDFLVLAFVSIAALIPIVKAALFALFACIIKRSFLPRWLIDPADVLGLERAAQSSRVEARLDTLQNGIDEVKVMLVDVQKQLKEQDASWRTTCKNTNASSENTLQNSTHEDWTWAR